MQERVQLETAFILHRRLYGDSSLIIDIFSREHGRISVIAKGYRKQKKYGNLLQPFNPLLFSWSGRGELKSLNDVEANGMSLQFKGKQLFSAMYINELLMRLLPKSDAHASLFDTYGQVLTELSSSETVEPQLRYFELCLMAELGYGINFECDAETGEPLQERVVYKFIADQGFFPYKQVDANQVDLFLGSDLHAIARFDWQEDQVRRAAKRLMRIAFAPHLGNKPLMSRELFR